MKKKCFSLILTLLFISCACSLSLMADDIYAPVAVYDEIADICHPTLDDYRKIQHYLTHGERSIIRYLKDYEPNARHIKIIGKAPEELPEFGDIAVNCDESERENCLILYASYNKNYPRGLRRLVNHVKNSDFKGHILYRVGGWPNVEGGSLALAHVPYAFKSSFFKEVQRLGYKRALWLDTSIIPLVSLNDIFAVIEQEGYFMMGNVHMIGPYMSWPALTAFSVTSQETYHIPSCSAGISGVDFTNAIGAEIIDRWYRAAQDKVAFFSPRSDQNALSIILYQLGLKLIDINLMVKDKKKIKPDSLLLIEREFVNEASGIPH